MTNTPHLHTEFLLWQVDRPWEEPQVASDHLCDRPGRHSRVLVTKEGRANYNDRYVWPPVNHRQEQLPSPRPVRTTQPDTRIYWGEDGFHTRPSIKLPIPDHIKALLVDDWENITKNNQLVPLPHRAPVDQILNDYLAYERPNREEGSASADILDEVVAGFREYFEKTLSRILLYRFERPQYHDMRKMWETAGPEGKNKNVCDTYGAEHLCRLIVSLPELIAQTNMDQQSVSRLREELSKLTVWLGKNAKTYFVNQYDTPNQEYIDKARGF